MSIAATTKSTPPATVPALSSPLVDQLTGAEVYAPTAETLKKTEPRVQHDDPPRHVPGRTVRRSGRLGPRRVAGDEEAESGRWCRDATSSRLAWAVSHPSYMARNVMTLKLHGAVAAPRSTTSRSRVQPPGDQPERTTVATLRIVDDRIGALEASTKQRYGGRGEEDRPDEEREPDHRVPTHDSCTPAAADGETRGADAEQHCDPRPPQRGRSRPCGDPADATPGWSRWPGGSGSR